MEGLIKYDAARNALQVCASIDEAKNILNQVEAMRVYARQVENNEMEQWLAEIKLRARRRIGEISKGLETRQGSRADTLLIPTGGNKSKAETLSNAGISKSVANRCEKLAAVPVERFESVIEKAKQTDKPVTYADVEKAITDNTHVSNNSGENEWYTPQTFINSARQTMGTIDLDPASSIIANKTVDAACFFTKDTDALKQEWYGNVWMNPPYAQPLISLFSARLCEYIENNNIRSACVLVNNATETAWFQGMAKIATGLCLIAKRVKFLDVNGNPGAPLQGQVVLYFGSCYELFYDNFSKHGEVFKGGNNV